MDRVMRENEIYQLSVFTLLGKFPLNIYICYRLNKSY